MRAGRGMCRSAAQQNRETLGSGGCGSGNPLGQITASGGGSLLGSKKSNSIGLPISGNSK
jgi:hypothetical protein